MVATLVAAFAPAAGTAVVMPRVAETAAAVLAPELSAVPAVVLPPAEDPELLALGAEIGPRLDAYRAAAAALVEARTVAEKLWPAVPEEIVVTTKRRRGFFGGCFEHEQDL